MYQLTKTSASYVVKNKCSAGEWSSDITWDAPPEILQPDGTVRIIGNVILNSDGGGHGSEGLFVCFAHISMTSEYSRTKTATVAAVIDGGPASAPLNQDLPVPSSGSKGDQIRLVYNAGLQSVWYIYTYNSDPDTSLKNQTCERLNVDLEEGTNTAVTTFSVIATVTDICYHQPLENALLEFTVFHTYNQTAKKWLNGEIVLGIGGLSKSDGTYELRVPDTIPGDMYRVDVYASKEGLDTSDNSLSVTTEGTPDTQEKPNGTPTVVPPCGSTGGPPNNLLLLVGTNGAVQNGPTAPTIITLDKSTTITQVKTYHWNNGRGTSLPGTITFVDLNQNINLPFYTTCGISVNNVENIYWVAEPYLVLSPGRYEIRDSDEKTRSYNDETKGIGCIWVYGY